LDAGSSGLNFVEPGTDFGLGQAVVDQAVEQPVFLFLELGEFAVQVAVEFFGGSLFVSLN